MGREGGLLSASNLRDRMDAALLLNFFIRFT